MRLEKQFDEVMAKWKETILRVQGLEKERDAALKRVEELTKALEAAARSLESVRRMAIGPDAEEPTSVAGYAENRAGVARLALSGSVKHGPQ